jgi:hypothetical protein
VGKLNCWDFKKCGRQSGGKKDQELGVCPASTEKRLNGVHEGMNSGRACWVVAGTFCRGEIQGAFVKKSVNCIKCDFYLSVLKEEDKNFVFSGELMKKLRQQEN